MKQEKTVRIPAISCGHCVNAIRLELEELDGVLSVEGDPGAKTVTVRWEPPADWETLARALAGIGYPPEED